MLDVRRLQILRAVVASGSVRAAAGNLGYTPSAVSQQIAVLEREANVPLLERVGRGVRPTAAGELLAEHAAAIAERVADAEMALADLRDGRAGRVAVRYFPTAGSALVAPALARLRGAHPQVQVDLALNDPLEPLAELERGQADLAIVVLPGATVPDGIRLETLLDDPFLVILPEGHRLAEHDTVELAALSEEPWVTGDSPGGTCQPLILDACARAGYAPRIVVDADDYATATGFVAAGLGVALVPRLGLVSPPPGVVVRPVRRPAASRPISVAVRQHSLDYEPVRVLLRALGDAARQAPSPVQHAADA